MSSLDLLDHVRARFFQLVVLSLQPEVEKEEALAKLAGWVSEQALLCESCPTVCLAGDSEQLEQLREAGRKGTVWCQNSVAEKHSTVGLLTDIPDAAKLISQKDVSAGLLEKDLWQSFLFTVLQHRHSEALRDGADAPVASCRTPSGRAPDVHNNTPVLRPSTSSGRAPVSEQTRPSGRECSVAWQSPSQPSGRAREALDQVCRSWCSGSLTLHELQGLASEQDVLRYLALSREAQFVPFSKSRILERLSLRAWPRDVPRPTTSADYDDYTDVYDLFSLSPAPAAADALPCPVPALRAAPAGRPEVCPRGVLGPAVPAGGAATAGLPALPAAAALPGRPVEHLSAPRSGACFACSSTFPGGVLDLGKFDACSETAGPGSHVEIFSPRQLLHSQKLVGRLSSDSGLAPPLERGRRVCPRMRVMSLPRRSWSPRRTQGPLASNEAQRGDGGSHLVGVSEHDSKELAEESETVLGQHCTTTPDVSVFSSKGLFKLEDRRGAETGRRANANRASCSHDSGRTSDRRRR